MEGSCVVSSRSVMMLCSSQIHLTILSALLMFISIGLFNNCHFAVRIPKAHSMHLFARDSLQLKTRSSMTNPFLRKAAVGMSLEDRRHHQE